jgi:uroporphyrinogen decarboxylase
LKELLTVLSDSITLYLKAQIRAGVQAVMIFDTWGGVLTPADYRDFSLEPMSRIIAELKANTETADIPVILFTKGGGAWLEDMVQTGCDALGLDWTVDIGEARRRVGSQLALQGNLDPAVLYARPERIRAAVGNVLNQFGSGNGHVFNLGHGINKNVHPDHLGILVDAVHELSRPYHELDP